ncbi:MAG: DUF4377 domain-containing protein [Caldilineaceae bacterium]
MLCLLFSSALLAANQIVAYAIEGNGDAPAPAALSIVKTRTSPAAIAASGDTVVFEIAVTNLGHTPLAAVALRDTYMSGCLQFADASQPIDHSDMGPEGAANLFWDNIGPLDAGQSQIITTTFTAQVQLDPMNNPVNCVDAINSAAAAILLGATPILEVHDHAEITVSDGEIQTLFVGPYRAPCTGLVPTTCLQVRPSPNEPWSNFFGEIAGFHHMPGMEYELRVLKEIIPNPPADAPNARHTLIEIVQQTNFGAEDADGDGVPNHAEITGPNGGDANADNIPDFEQANVGSVSAAEGQGHIAVAATGDCAVVKTMVSSREHGSGLADGNFNFPLGLVAYTLECTEPGQSATVEYYWHTEADLSQLVFRKYGPTTPGNPATAAWYDFPIALEIIEIPVNENGTVVMKPVLKGTVTLTDGQLGDDTGLDAMIVDPGGLATGSPDVQLEKRLTSTGPFQPGEPLVYTIVITNTSGQVLTTLPLTDTYDANYLSFDSVSGANPTPDDKGDDGQLNWSDLTTALGDLNPGDVRQVVVHFTALQETSNAIDCDGNPGAACNTVTMAGGISGTAQSQVSIRIDPLPGKSSIGDFVWHDWNGDGVQDANEPGLNGVLINLYYDENGNNQIDAGEFVTSTITADDTGGAPGYYLFPTVVGDQPYIVEIDPSNFAAGGALENYVFSNDKTTVPVNSSERTQILQLGNPENRTDVDFALYCPFDLALIKTLGAGQAAGIAPGEDVTFTLAVINQGVVTAANVVLVDYLPAGFTLSANDANGWVPSGGNVTLALPGVVAPNAPRLVDIVLTVGAGPTGVYTNTAEIAAATDESSNVLPDVDSTPDMIDGNGTNGNGGEAGDLEDDQINEDGKQPGQDEDDHDVSVVTILPPPALALTKTLDAAEPVRTGAMVSFTVRITNTGSVTITVLPLEDDYNSLYLTYLTATTAPDGLLPGVLTWNNLAPANGLAPGASVSVRVVFRAEVDSSLSNPTPPCTQPGEAPNVVHVRNAQADMDGAGPLPVMNVPAYDACATVEITDPTAVQLAAQGVAQVSDGVLVSWSTITENDIVGFNLWRNSGVAVERRSSEMIAAKVAGQSGGASYEWLDAGVTLHSGYIYLLEVVRTNGSTAFTPLRNIAARDIYLPFIVQ